jgi:hypothetical protein
MISDQSLKLSNLKMLEFIATRASSLVESIANTCSQYSKAAALKHQPIAIIKSMTYDIGMIKTSH